MRPPLIVLALAAACSAAPDEPGGTFAQDSADNRATHIPFQGGSVLPHPREVHLYWGSYFQTPAGRHEAMTLRGIGLADVKYSSIPHGDCPDGCSVRGVHVNGPALDQETSTLSHELLEAVTDPDLDGWTTGKGENEVGDLCNGGFAASWSGERFAVQHIWSNKDRRCAARP